MTAMSVEDRLQKHLDQTGGPDACWPWTGYRTTDGYGHTYVARDGKFPSISAHRLAYILAFGEPADGLFILHSCDNPPCCNPAHLRAGTHVENMADRKRHGAGYATGEAHHGAIQVSNDVIAAIRAEYRPHVRGRGQHALASRFGLSRSEIQRIVTRSDRWAESA